jgi:hypothetical protein
MYVLVFMGTLWRESSVVVNLAISCVIKVAKAMCHVVKNNAGESYRQ